MEKESYRIIKEISSLHTHKQKLIAETNNEGGRLDKILKMEEERAQKLTEDQTLRGELSIELTQVENSIATLSSQLEQTQANKNNVFTEDEISAFEKQSEHLSSELSLKEEQGLELLEKIESLEAEINDAKTFLTGIQETKIEIQDEILADNKPLLDQTKNIDTRIENLFKELPQKIQPKIHDLLNKNLKYGPTAQIENDHCSICKMGLSKMKVQEIEKSLHFHCCEGCERVFIPVSSLY